MLQALQARHRDLAWEFLTRNGLRDVFLAGKVHEGALAQPDAASAGRFYGAFRGDRLDGVLFLGHGGLAVFSADLPHVRRIFAEQAWKQRERLKLLVGEWESMSDFWSHLAATGIAARRDWREIFCEVDPRTLAEDGEPELRAATPADLGDVAEASARAYLEETGEDPRITRGEGYQQRVLRSVEAGRCFILRDRGRLVFKADVSAYCPIGAQIAGVYTDPEFRGRGIARRSMVELSRRLLDHVPAVCLFVKEGNAAARRAYDRAGYRQVFFYRTIFVDSAPKPDRPVDPRPRARRKTQAPERAAAKPRSRSAPA